MNLTLSLSPLELEFRSINASSTTSPHSTCSSSGLSSGSLLVFAINAPSNNQKGVDLLSKIKNDDQGRESSLKDSDDECASDYLFIWRDPISRQVSVSLCSQEYKKSSMSVESEPSNSTRGLEHVPEPNSPSPEIQQLEGSTRKKPARVLQLAEHKVDNKSSSSSDEDPDEISIDSRFPVVEAMALHGSFLFIAASPQSSSRKGEEEKERGREKRDDDDGDYEDDDNIDDDDDEEGRLSDMDRGARLLVYDLLQTRTLLSYPSSPSVSLPLSSLSPSSSQTSSSSSSSSSSKASKLLTQTPCGVSLTTLSLPAVSISFATYSSPSLKHVDNKKKEMAATRVWVVSCSGEAVSIPLLDTISGMDAVSASSSEGLDSKTAVTPAKKRISRWSLEPTAHHHSSTSSSSSSSSDRAISCAAISSSCSQDPSLSLLSSLFDDAASLATEMAAPQVSVLSPKVTLFAGGSSPLFYSFNLSHNEVVEEDSYSNETSLAAHVSSALSLLSESIRSPVLSGFAMLFGASSKSSSNNNNSSNTEQPVVNKSRDSGKHQQQHFTRPVRVLDRGKESMENSGLPGGHNKPLLLFGGVGGKISLDASGGSSLATTLSSAPERVALQVLVDPSQRYLAVATSDSRVFLFYTSDCSVLRIWKGQRNAQLAFINTSSPLSSSSSSSSSSPASNNGGIRKRLQSKQPPLLVIYSPSRGSLTAWPVRTGQAVGSLRVPKGGCIGKSEGGGVRERLFFFVLTDKGELKTFCIEGL